MRVAFGVAFIEGYGLTETTAATTIADPTDHTNFHVGMPAVCCEIKLEDVPEMGYASVCIRAEP